MTKADTKVDPSANATGIALAELLWNFQSYKPPLESFIQEAYSNKPDGAKNIVKT